MPYFQTYIYKTFTKMEQFLVYGKGNINLGRKGWVIQEMVLDQFAIQRDKDSFHISTENTF